MGEKINISKGYFLSNCISKGINFEFNNKKYKTSYNDFSGLKYYIDDIEQNETGRIAVNLIERIILMYKVDFQSEEYHYYFESKSWFRKIMDNKKTFNISEEQSNKLYMHLLGKGLNEGQISDVFGRIKTEEDYKKYLK